MTDFPGHGDNFRTLGKVNAEQTLKALERVSRGEVWNIPPTDGDWQHIRDPIARILHAMLSREAAE